MNKTLIIILGIVLLVFGGISLAKGGIPHTKRHTFDIAIAHGSVNTKEVWPVHPVLAWLSIAGGAALIVVGVRGNK